ncbi:MULTISPECIES: SCO family protein [Sphingobacterium]|uniref:SCO family protein n=1 Tax=Sphingobacterium tenebrionis TaxID=3111775 RepID=A0ABU8I8Z7_9SPHI|nr:SCO family protein [Sphingobacterium sp. 1.A.4]
MKKIVGLASFTLFAGLLFQSCDNTERKLPILGEATVEKKMVDGKEVIDSIYPTIPDFKFLNQDSAYITQDFFKDKIYVANFFFTHCPSICPTMQRNLLKAYEKYKNNPKIAFLSHSIDFKYDQPHVLKDYANKLGIDNDQWQFVMGSKADIYGISEKYLVYTKEDASVPGGYDHSGYLVIIDPERRLRGAYDGTNDEQVTKLLEDLDVILNEYR